LKKLAAGTHIDGFEIGTCLHAGGMAHIYEVTYADHRAAPFAMVMKVPRMTAGDGAENIVGFEVEHQILQVLHGRHVPRFVAAGDLVTLPYLVMEHVRGDTLQQVLDQHEQTRTRPSAQDIARMGAAIARAAHSLHQQNTCHLVCHATPITPTCWLKSCARLLVHPHGLHLNKWWVCAVTRVATFLLWV
jgi:serine/threonine protein kinase